MNLNFRAGGARIFGDPHASPWHGRPARVGVAEQTKTAANRVSSLSPATRTGRMPVPRGGVNFIDGKIPACPLPWYSGGGLGWGFVRLAGDGRSANWHRLACSLLILILTTQALADDWPQYGHDASRNMVAPHETGLVSDADPASGRNVLWTAQLGSQSYGNVTVADGRLFLGTNNSSPRVSKYAGDYGILLCLDEKTGQLDWQLAVPKLRAGKVSDWDEVGFCSSPTVEGNRIYAVTNRCEVICLTTAGFTGSNQGPFLDEAHYTAGPGKPPIPQGPSDADIVWRFDMRDELGVFPHNMTSSSVLIVGDRLFVTTSNGVDWNGKHLPAPARRR